jgi:hypothetical protein
MKITPTSLPEVLLEPKVFGWSRIFHGKLEYAATRLDVQFVQEELGYRSADEGLCSTPLASAYARKAPE